MKITWIGHSCFKIEKNGYALVIDPYMDGSVPGLLPVREKANMVLCTHEHGDHNFRDSVEIIQDVENPFKITEIHTYHDDAQGTLRGRNKIFLIEDGENRIAHMGDVGCMLTEEQLSQLKNMDAVLIPVGGYYTVDGQQAFELIEKMNPRIAVPMHFRSEKEGFGFAEISTEKEFTERAGDVTDLSGCELDTKETYTTQTVMLHPQNVTK